MRQPGRHFLQIPGPSAVPDRILRAIAMPVIDHYNAVSSKALAANATATLPNAYWQWRDMIEANKRGYFPYTPATNLLFGLAEAIDMLHEEGLDLVFARHKRHAAATRAAVRAWGLEVQCTVAEEYSPVLTAVRVPEGTDADALRATIVEHCNMSLGNGLSKVQGKVFRIGHLGDFSDVMLLGTMGGIEMGLHLANVPHQGGGTQGRARLPEINPLDMQEAALVRKRVWSSSQVRHLY